MDYVIKQVSSRYLNEIAKIASETNKLKLAESLLLFKKEFLQIHSERLSQDKRLMIFVALDSKDQVCGYARLKYHKQTDKEPSGWYQMGLIVKKGLRRKGIATLLCKDRENWLHDCKETFCFINSNNKASIDLHKKLGFTLIDDDFKFPNVDFTNGCGLLFCKY
ncbi:MAG: GNAT family N-acetyltransferase [Candidatus Cloacimonetes bacterium]|nr:GNAT family N-acetyltransferase [Candidatus Cloacimonadota bacterium]